ncbi:MAG: alpha-L-glutamate ligase, partial [Kiloniellales bacterium]
FDRAPPQGVFYNRMSASSHTRGHRYAPELTHGVLNWLEAYERRVVNTSRALYLELSKLAQYAALERAGVRTPRTVAAVGRDHVLAAAHDFGAGPWILKPNRGGKGLGVQLFPSIEAMAAYLDGPGARDEAPIDGIWLIQDYIRPNEPFITRCEFVGGAFLYAVRVDTSDGFELCPADACNVEDAFCPSDAPKPNKFTIVTDFDDPILDRYARFLAENGIEIAGIEFITDARGEIYTYDVNTNTNYNAQAEAEAAVPLPGMRAVARFLGAELAKVRRQAPLAAAS